MLGSGGGFPPERPGRDAGCSSMPSVAGPMQVPVKLPPILTIPTLPHGHPRVADGCSRPHPPPPTHPPHPTFCAQVVSRDIRRILTQRARYFNIVLDDVSITQLTFSREYTSAVEAKQVAQQDAERAKFIVSGRSGRCCPVCLHSCVRVWWVAGWVALSLGGGWAAGCPTTLPASASLLAGPEQAPAAGEGEARAAHPPAHFQPAWLWTGVAAWTGSSSHLGRPGIALLSPSVCRWHRPAPRKGELALSADTMWHGQPQACYG
jgi:hypothetical protein